MLRGRERLVQYEHALFQNGITLYVVQKKFTKTNVDRLFIAPGNKTDRMYHGSEMYISVAIAQGGHLKWM